MGKVRIITDSAADLSPEVVSALDITVIPMRIRLGSETLVDDPSLRSVDFHQRMLKQRGHCTVIPPTIQQFTEAYTRLSAETEDILAIHLSSALSNTLQIAKQASIPFLGRCRIATLDSQLISRAMGLLVIEAAAAAQRGMESAELVRYVRGIVPHLYFAFYVEAIEPLKRAQLIRYPRYTIGSAPNVKPLLILEEGVITPVQRLHNRGKPAERLFEFAAEFAELKHLAIVHGAAGEQVAELKALLAERFPQQPIEEHIFGPTLSAYIGSTALGVVAFEG